MSEIRVNSVKGVGATDPAISINNSDGTCRANITNNLSNRRLNINGQMSVVQRGTSITSQGYTPDRYYQEFNNAGSITHTISQQSLTSSDTPYSLGFRYFQRHALSAAGTANAAADLHTQHTIEAQDMAHSGWNYTSTSSFLTISFWVRVSTSQKFYLSLRTRDGTSQNYNIPFTPSENTWTKVIAKVPGNSNLQFDNNNDKGLHLNFYKFLGTDDTGGSSENAWVAYSGTAKVPDMASTWLTAGASTFDLTGLQVEVGSVATDFEHRSFAEELALCKRYFQHWMGSYRYSSTSSQHHAVSFYPSMRAIPTVVRTAYYFGSYEDGSTTANVNFQIGSNGCIGQTYLLHYGNSSSTAVGGYGTLSAEL
tara:strand:+ start:1654 stop:2754 length:1101 start_codon:yes stop_codon:yes gene_type:complete